MSGSLAAAEPLRTGAPGTAGAGALSRRERIIAAARLEVLVWSRWHILILLGACVLYLVCITGMGRLDLVGFPSLVISAIAAPTVILLGLCLAHWMPEAFAPEAGDGMRRLHGALPITRRDTVSARYLLLLAYLGAALLAVVCSLVGALGASDHRTWAIALAWMLQVAVLYSVMVPAAIKYGTGPMTMAVLCGVMVFSGLVTGFAVGFEKPALILPGILHGMRLLGLAVLVVLLSAALIHGSWRLSCRIYERQDH